MDSAFESAHVPPPCEWVTEERREQVVVELAGVVDVGTVGELTMILEPYLATGRPIFLKMAAVHHIDSYGLGVLCAARRRHARLAVLCPSPPVRRALDYIDPPLRYYDSAEPTREIIADVSAR